MKKRKNRRTLRKRIRRIMSLSAFIIVICFSGLISTIILVGSHELAVSQADIVCKEIQTKINTGEAQRLLGVKNIDKLDQNSGLIKLWIDGITKKSLLNQLDFFHLTPNVFLIQIEVNEEIFYSNYEKEFSRWSDYYRETTSERMLLDPTSYAIIGKVTARVNPKFLVPMVTIILGLVFLISAVALFVDKILRMFLIIPIIKPINQMEKKFRALAEGDHETASNTQMILKRPLREIESMADSTNTIMKKLHGYNETLEQQKYVLEQQNAELEEQNDELGRSKQQIQEQQAQLVQSEKMASVGLLTAAITHEINTPIGAINSNAQISELLINEVMNNSSVNTDEELMSMVLQMKEANDINLMACKRIIEIIKSLKTFSRLDQAEYQDADINEGINSVLILTNNILKNKITVHKEFGEIPTAACFPGQLNQVFMNIIVNAAQAMEDGGELWIHTCCVEDDICVTIKDTGHGISPENLGKIFEPGYTTRGVGIGLGIGLYLSYNIIQNHNGEITVTSELGKGTQFTIRIPINHEVK